jgi:hypothetical protein
LGISFTTDDVDLSSSVDCFDCIRNNHGPAEWFDQLELRRT